MTLTTTTPPAVCGDDLDGPSFRVAVSVDDLLPPVPRARRPRLRVLDVGVPDLLCRLQSWTARLAGAS